MAGRLNIIGDVATVTDVPNYQRVQLIVRDNVATISHVGDVKEEKGDVVAVERVDTHRWLIRFVDGSAWAANVPQRGKAGCGCS